MMPIISNILSDIVLADECYLDKRGTMQVSPSPHLSGITVPPCRRFESILARRITLRPLMVPIISNVLGDFREYLTRARHGAGARIRTLVSHPELRKVHARIDIYDVSFDARALHGAPKGIPSSHRCASISCPPLSRRAPCSSTRRTSIFDVVRFWCIHSESPAWACRRTLHANEGRSSVSFRESASAVVLEPAASDPQIRGLITEYPGLQRWLQYSATDNDFVSGFGTTICYLSGSLGAHRVGGMAYVVLPRTKFEKPVVYDENVERSHSPLHHEIRLDAAPHHTMGNRRAASRVDAA
ncbi:hypothetical protein C8R45DRAFT_1223300 [Mycena sanguinolenta]|nr:hypothetical protein C8R45DRAFT_1223300 [Mycena sanguinolenta]